VASSKNNNINKNNTIRKYSIQTVKKWGEQNKVLDKEK
jgi:hypothetical protein